MKSSNSLRSPERIQSLYSSGRMAAIRQEFGISNASAWRLCKKHGIATSRRMLQYDDSVFESIDTPHKAYVLGLIVSDGYVVEGPKRYVVNLGSTDREIPEAFRELVGLNRPLYVIVPDAKKRLQTEYRISICSQKLVGDIVALGVRQRKSLKETSPLACDDPLAHHFVRGVFDGDGCVMMYRGQARFSIVGSEEMCRFVARFFEARGLPNINVRHRQNGLWLVQTCGNNIVPAIGKILYQDATHWLMRKREVFDAIPPARKWVCSFWGQSVQ